MVAIIDYGVGNLFSLCSSLQRIGAEAVVTSDPDVIRKADKLILPEPCPHSTPSWFGFLLTCREGVSRETVLAHLEKRGIQTRMLFSGNLICHPCFDAMRASGTGYRVVGELANTDTVMNRTFWVGVYPGMSDEMIDHIARAIKEAVS